MILRRYRVHDGPGCAGVFRAAVIIGAAGYYSDEHCRIWAKAADDPAFITRLDRQITIVAQENDAIRGFMSLCANGHVDLAYIHPDERRGGLADQLLSAILEQARAMGLPHLTTEASHPARRFFLKRGWREDTAQQVQRGGLTFENFRMSYTLPSSHSD